VLLITQREELLKQFCSLRNQHLGLIALLIFERDLCKWRLQTKNTNTLLFIKPVRVELLIQHLEQYSVSTALVNKKPPHYVELHKLLISQQNLTLTNLEKRCLQFLLDAQYGKVHKLSLQIYLFGESGYLCDARLDSCWHRLRKKLSACAPKVMLKREYNGFLEIATCTS